MRTWNETNNSHSKIYSFTLTIEDEISLYFIYNQIIVIRLQTVDLYVDKL